MSCFTPNFYDVFLTKFCRDKLACTIPCKPVNTCPGTDVRAVYPHVNRALREVYANQNVSNFNEAYQALSIYLTAYPEVVNKINAVLWKWIDRKSKKPARFNCRPVRYCGDDFDHDHVDLDPSSSVLPYNLQNKVTNPANRKNSWCCRKERSLCDSDSEDHYDERSYDDCGYCGGCSRKKDCDGCGERKHREYCGVDELDCEPRCGAKVEYEVPEPTLTCDPLPCTNSLKRDLTELVPYCLRNDRKLQQLIANVVGYLL